MPLDNKNLNRIFVYVPAAEVANFKTGAGLTNAYKNRISFLSSTGEIMTNGEIFAINRDADLAAIEALIGANASNLLTNLGLGNDFDGSTIVAAIKYVYETANNLNNALDERLDIIEGDGEGSIEKAVSDAIAALINDAPETLDTLKEIADWISRDGADAANLVSRVEELEEHIEENEQVTAAGLIDLQKQIDEMVGGGGSIQQQITANIETLDSSVTLAGSTAAQPQNVGIDTSVDVLGSITVSEVDGLLDQDSSSNVVLQADAAGAARKAFDTLMGTNADTIDMLTMKGVQGRVNYLTRTGTLSVAQSGTTLSYDSSTGNLATVQNIADAINNIEMWETFSSSQD